MLRRSFSLRTGIMPANNKTHEDDILFTRLRDRHVPRRFNLRALTGTRVQGWAAAGGILLGAAFFLGPWMWDEWQELLNKKFVPLDPSAMPRTSPDWWENEWRKMTITWRAGESSPNFFVKPYAFVRGMTGRDLSSAEALVATRPVSDNSYNGSSGNGSGVSWWKFWTRAGDNNATTPHGMRRVVASAFVPLCGDSPIVRTLALQGYDVDAIDSSQTAIQSAVGKTEMGLPLDAFDHVHFRWRDFFSPELWSGGGAYDGKRFDLIYERQAMTSLNREQRQDYAYLLKRALRDDGVIYVEGIFRTGRVKGNKVRGPPYSLSKRELEHLFPESEGLFVRCEEKNDALTKLSRENRVLQRVPKEMYTTPFNCVVFRAAAVNLEERDRFNNQQQ